MYVSIPTYTEGAEEDLKLVLWGKECGAEMECPRLLLEP